MQSSDLYKKQQRLNAKLLSPAHLACSKHGCRHWKIVPRKSNSQCSFPRSATKLSVALLPSVAVSGCSTEKITVYIVPKENPVLDRVQNEHGTIVDLTNTAQFVSGTLGCTVPPGWIELPPTQFALVRFVVSGPGGHAQITATVLPGNAGGLLANVNRWRSQVNLEQIVEADLAETVKKIETHAGTAQVVDFVGADPETGRKTRLISVMPPHGDRTWFFKIIGEAEVVAHQKDAFLQFVQTTRFD